MSSAVYSPDGHRLVRSSADGTLRVWNPATGRSLRTIQVGADARSVAFSQDGRTLVSGQDANGLMSVFETSGWTRTGEIGSREEPVLALAFVDDRTLVSFADNESVATVWALDGGRALRALRGHNGAILGVAGAPTAGPSRRAAPTARQSVRFSPEGRFLATASIDGTVALHPLRVEELTALARTRVTRSLTDDECRQYLRTSGCRR